MKIGCITLVPVSPQWKGDFRQVAAINCTKGRGLILPGGKWEDGELFEQTASREFTEETGQNLNGLPKLFFQAMNIDGYYVYTFLGDCPGYSPFVQTNEGESRYALWVDLLKSYHAPYYSLLRQHIEDKGYFTGDQ